jgi:hypothetical protein
MPYIDTITADTCHILVLTADVVNLLILPADTSHILMLPASTAQRVIIIFQRNHHFIRCLTIAQSVNHLNKFYVKCD